MKTCTITETHTAMQSSARNDEVQLCMTYNCN